MNITFIKNPAIGPGSWVLVTGVNGLVGSHVADQLLAHGYRVRGSVRNIEKNAWMVGLFDTKYGNGRFELVQVIDIAQEGAFDMAIKGVAGVVHVASVVSFDPDPDRVIPLVVNSTVGILKSAAAEPSVKRFVLTSSYSAVVQPQPDHRIRVTTETWNEEATALVENLPSGLTDVQKGLCVYSASKVKGEQALWDWVKQNKPSFVVNSVIPGGNFGAILDPKNQGFPSTTLLASALFDNNKELIRTFVSEYPPEWFVDVQDNALLHVAALVRSDVSGERVFACASPINNNLTLKTLRRLFPEREFPQDFPGLWDDMAVIEPAARAKSLLRDMGRDGFTSLEESLKRTLQSS